MMVANVAIIPLPLTLGIITMAISSTKCSAAVATLSIAIIYRRSTPTIVFGITIGIANTTMSHHPSSISIFSITTILLTLHHRKSPFTLP